MAKKELKSNPDYYRNLTKRFPVEIVSPFEEIINLDLNRTFPNDEYFKDKRVITKLKNILLAYSRRNVTLGYCQGFNFFVGRLMKVMDSEVSIKFNIKDKKISENKLFYNRKKYFGFFVRLSKIFYL